MAQPVQRIAPRNVPKRRLRRARGFSPRFFLTYHLRQQAQIGLLRDGGLTPGDVGRYVRELRKEIEAGMVRRPSAVRTQFAESQRNRAG